MKLGNVIINASVYLAEVIPDLGYFPLLLLAKLGSFNEDPELLFQQVYQLQCIGHITTESAIIVPNPFNFYNRNHTISNIESFTLKISLHFLKIRLFSTLTRKASANALVYLKGLLLCRRRNCQMLVMELQESNQQGLHQFV